MYYRPLKRNNTLLVSWRSVLFGPFYWWRKPEFHEKTTYLLQVTDKLYHIKITLILLPIKNSQATVDGKKKIHTWLLMKIKCAHDCSWKKINIIYNATQVYTFEFFFYQNLQNVWCLYLNGLRDRLKMWQFYSNEVSFIWLRPPTHPSMFNT